MLSRCGGGQGTSRSMPALPAPAGFVNGIKPGHSENEGGKESDVLIFCARALAHDARDTGDHEMPQAERRKSDVRIVTALKRELNADQRMALVELEKFGWELKFIRRPMFQQPVPVVFDSDRRNYAVLQPDGTLDENPGFNIRK